MEPPVEPTVVAVQPPQCFSSSFHAWSWLLHAVFEKPFLPKIFDFDLEVPVFNEQSIGCRWEVLFARINLSRMSSSLEVWLLQWLLTVKRCERSCYRDTWLVEVQKDHLLLGGSLYQCPSDSEKTEKDVWEAPVEWWSFSVRVMLLMCGLTTLYSWTKPTWDPRRRSPSLRCNSNGFHSGGHSGDPILPTWAVCRFSIVA